MKLTLKAFKNRFKSYWLNFVNRIPVYHELDYPKARIFLCDNVRLAECTKEPDTVRWIESFQNGQEEAFDIGANVGQYSMIMALYVKEVYAFEPAVTNFNLLCKNLALNVQKGTIPNNVTPLNLALAACTGMKRFNYINANPGKSGHQVEGTVDGYGTKFVPQYSHSVLCYALDDLIQSLGLPVPNHIKIDVDGTELEILKGAAATLSNPRVKTLLVEVNEERDASVEIKEYLLRKGFKIHDRFKATPEFEFYNYLFTR